MKGIKRQLNTSQLYGSGLALILIFLLISHFSNERVFLQIAIVITILLIVWPAPFKYFGKLWFVLAEGLGFVTSRVVLSVIFFLVVVPVGAVKRNNLRRKMDLHQFKKSNKSVFKIRDHQFLPQDFLKPF